jgi:ribosomal protein L37AE/L43A
MLSTLSGIQSWNDTAKKKALRFRGLPLLLPYPRRSQGHLRQISNAGDGRLMVRRINLDKVQASLDAVCPKCGKKISPAEVRRVDFQNIICPVCGERFTPGGSNLCEESRLSLGEFNGYRALCVVRRHS